MRFFLLPLLLILIAPLAASSVTIWSGPWLHYEQPSADPSDDANWDRLTDLVAITRGATRGLFNPLAESVYTNPSPAGTEWAFSANNSVDPSEILAENYAALNFDVWREAAGNNPPGTVGQPGVLHLIDEDIYLDIEFTSFTSGGSGTGSGFSWRHTTVPEPSTALLLGGGLLSLGYSSRVARNRARSAPSTPRALRK